jgi:hypothetical protein
MVCAHLSAILSILPIRSRRSETTRIPDPALRKRASARFRVYHRQAPDAGMSLASRLTWTLCCQYNRRGRQRSV